MDETGRHFLQEFMTGKRPKPSPNKWVNGSLWTLMSLLIGALIYLLIREINPRRDPTAFRPQHHSYPMRPYAFDKLGVAVIATFAALASAGQPQAASSRLPDQCRASEFVRFVGKPVTDLQQMQLPDARFVCEHCAATADVRASRLTVIYSDKNNQIIRLRCE